MGPLPRPKRERAHAPDGVTDGLQAAGPCPNRPTAVGGFGLSLRLAQTRRVRLRPVTVEAMITRTAATAMATSQRIQSTPRVRSPPKAV
jgi:hypothetical protein